MKKGNEVILQQQLQPKLLQISTFSFLSYESSEALSQTMPATLPINPFLNFIGIVESYYSVASCMSLNYITNIVDSMGFPTHQ